MWTISHWDARHGRIDDATAHDRTLAQNCRDDYVGRGLIPAAAFIAPSDSRPQLMHRSELASWTCPTHGQTADSGTFYLADRAPFQQIAVRQLTCPNDHQWWDETDGS